jgi:hypothetical protein
MERELAGCNRSTQRRPAPVALSEPQIPYDLCSVEPGPPLWEASDNPSELLLFPKLTLQSSPLEDSRSGSS